MNVVGKIKTQIKRNRYGKLFLEQYGFKTTVLAVCSVVINIGFAAVNLVSAIKYASVWYGSLAGYYGALILFRSIVISVNLACGKKYSGDKSRLGLSKLKIFLVSGAVLVILEIAMCVAVTQMIISERPAKSGTIMAITTAVYAFYKITMATVNLSKARKHGDLAVQALRNLNFAAACMSMVSLTVLLLSTFGEADEKAFLVAIKAGVGFAACATVLGIASYMIIMSVSKLKKEKENGQEQ